MLPSRGALRQCHATGGRHTAHPKPSRNLRTLHPSYITRGSRRFGTGLGRYGRFPHDNPPAVSLPRHGIVNPVFKAAVATSLLSQHARFASTNPSSSTPVPGAPGSPPPSSLENLDFTTPLDLDRLSLLDIPERIGFLRELGLDYGWGPTSCMQWLVEHAHVSLGLPWWAAVPAVWLGVRLALARPSLTASEQSVKMTRLRQDPEYVAATARLMQLVRGTSPREKSEALATRRAIQAMHRAAGFQTWRTLVPFINLPIGFGMFRLLRGMTGLPVPGLEDAGLFWFHDLTVADPYFVLPLLSSSIMFAMMRNNIKYLPAQQARMMGIFNYAVTPLTLVVTLNMAAGLQWFFLISGLMQVIQSTVFQNTVFRQRMGLPPMRLGGEPAAPPSNIQWQAPGGAADRVVDTTARVVETTDVADTGLRGAFTGMKKQATEYMDRKRERQAGSNADEYEQRRASEDAAKTYTRGQVNRMTKPKR